MPIKNYSTVVPPDKSAAQIVALLVRKGATTISQKFNAAGELVAISFVIEVNGGPIPFVLPVNVDGVAAALHRERPWNRNRNCGKEAYAIKLHAEARWVAWRILRDWVEAQIAMIESGQVEMPQVFLPYATSASGHTVYQAFIEDTQRRLGGGN